MTTLTEHFDVTHKREDKFDYVTWSQVADRLDAVGEPWSFSIMGIGPDWAHGRLTIGQRHYENIGYAENAEANWKKEPLKDATSDAFKRCAALAGVARYLYDKDDRPQARTTQRTATTSVPAARPSFVDTSVPDIEEPEWLAPQAAFQPIVPFDATVDDNKVCPIHAVVWAGSPGDLWHKDPEGKYCRHPDNVRKARASR